MQIKWTKHALSRLDRSLNYCHREFGENVATKFYNKVKNYVSLLADNPRLGKIEPLLISKHSHEYRSLVIHPHFRLVYYINKEKERIVITNLWDVRQEPSKLKQI